MLVWPDTCDCSEFTEAVIVETSLFVGVLACKVCNAVWMFAFRVCSPFVVESDRFFCRLQSPLVIAVVSLAASEFRMPFNVPTLSLVIVLYWVFVMLRLE